MKLLSVLNFAHQLLSEHLQNGDNAIDATMGNGNDTVKLAQLVGDSGQVYAFDIQAMALINTEKRLREQSLNHRVQLILDGHQHLQRYIHKPISAAIFNLGYLPCSNKNITTQPQNTIKACEEVLNLLPQSGMIILVIYSGHDNAEEAKKIHQWASALSQKQFSVLQYGFINQKNYPPYLLAIQKIK